MARRGVLFLSAALLMACTNTVFDGEAGSGGAGGDVANGGEGGTSNPPPAGGGTGGCGIDCSLNAVVYEEAPISGTGGGSSTGQTTVASTTGGPSFERVHLQLSDFGETCAVAAQPLPCGGYTRYTISLPKSMLVPGIVLLSHPDVWLTMQETTELNGDECGFGGGGGFEDGQLEIFAVDGTTLTGVLSGIEVFGGYDPNGHVEAALCF